MKNGFRSRNLGDLCEVVGGGTPSKDKPAYYSGKIPWATVRDMRQDVITETEFRITEDAVQNSATNIIASGNVVIATRVGLGKVCLLGQDTAINQDLRGVIPRDTKVLSVRFLFWWLKSITEVIVAEGTGATVQGVKLAFVKSLQIPALPLPEQERIVGILDEAFEGIATAKANAEENLQNARALIQPTFIAILHSFDQTSWRVSTVEKAASTEKSSIRTGPFGSQLLHSEFVEEGISVLGIDNAVQNRFAWNERRYITPQKFSELSRYQVKPGDVLVTIMGTCGRCAIVPHDIPTAINSKHLCCITLDHQKCLPEFLHAYFLYHPTVHEFLSRKAKGSIMAGLNMGIIRELPLLLPPVEQQRAIAKKVSEVRKSAEDLESIYRRKLVALDALEKSLLNQAFTGELTAQPEKLLEQGAA